MYGRAVKTAMCVKFGGATGAMGVHEFGISETKNPITVPNNSEGTIGPKQDSKPARSTPATPKRGQYALRKDCRDAVCLSTNKQTPRYANWYSGWD